VTIVDFGRRASEGSDALRYSRMSGCTPNRLGERRSRLFTGRQNPHLFPVIRELFAAIQTNDIGASSHGGSGTPLSGALGDWKAVVFVPTTEQQVGYFRQHQIPPPNTWESVRMKREFPFQLLRFSHFQFGFARRELAGRE
jgi:hypothetical protein